MKRVLVVEDEPGIALVLEDSLRLEGHDVEVIANGLAASERACEGKFDLILLDGMLPGKDGFEVCRDLRRAGVKTPVIFLSARAQVANRVHGLDLGANDYVVKPFSPEELMARVRRHLQHEEEIRDDQQNLEGEIRAAAEVQERLLPRVHPAILGFDYAAVCRPAKHVSGDSYDFIELDDGSLGFLVADVCGKGMPAALLAAALHGSIRAYLAAAGRRCGELFVRANGLLFDTTAPERYATAFYGVYDPRTNTLTYANAGHYAPWLVRPNGTERLESMTAPLGLFPEIPASERTIQLTAGDWLVIASDGIPEACDSRDQEFGDRRLLSLMQPRPANALAFCRKALAAVADFCGDAFRWTDDLTVLAAHVLPEEQNPAQVKHSDIESLSCAEESPVWSGNSICLQQR